MSKKKIISGKELSEIIEYNTRDYYPFYQTRLLYELFTDPTKLKENYTDVPIYCGCLDIPIEPGDGHPILSIVKRPKDQQLFRILRENCKDRSNYLYKDFHDIVKDGKFESIDFKNFKEIFPNLNSLEYQTFLKENGLIEIFSHSAFMNGCHGMTTVIDVLNQEEIEIPKNIPISRIKRTKDSGNIYHLGYCIFGFKVGKINTKEVFYSLGGDGSVGFEFGGNCVNREPYFVPKNKSALDA